MLFLTQVTRKRQDLRATRCIFLFLSTINKQYAFGSSILHHHRQPHTIYGDEKKVFELHATRFTKHQPFSASILAYDVTPHVTLRRVMASFSSPFLFSLPGSLSWIYSLCFLVVGLNALYSSLFFSSPFPFLSLSLCFIFMWVSPRLLFCLFHFLSLFKFVSFPHFPFLFFLSLI